MGSIDMTIESSTVGPVRHQSAQTQFLDVGGVRFAFRRFGRSRATPLVMLQHFRGNLDSWDPALSDALAGEREVILVDYPGVKFLKWRVRPDDRRHGEADDRVSHRA